MPRTPIRLSALFLALLFLATTAKEALGLGCPHHDLVTTGAAATHSETGDHSTGEPSAVHTKIAPPQHHHPGAQQADTAADHPADEAGNCTCVGNCNGTPTTSPPSTPAFRLDTIAAGATALIPEAEAELAAPTPYLHPFATAPPLER